MGGNVFSDGVTRRYQADEYFDLADEVGDKLLRISDVMGYEIIPAYREKESFGDCDILYSTCDDVPIDQFIFSTHFNTSYVSRNSEVTSIAYKQLQIDFIHIPQKHFDYALGFFSNNDFGNIASKLFRYFGLRHGHMGLYLVLRDGDNKFGEVLLTLDHDLALTFIELDPTVFNSGFDNLKEMFDYAVTSPYYNPENYLLENISSAGRIRDKKRPTYQAFLKYGETYTGPRAEKVIDKSVFLQKIFEFFPDAYPAYKDAMQKLAVQKFVKEKFNGNIVSDITGLRNKELGVFMQELKKDWYCSPENIIYLSDKQLFDLVMVKLRVSKVAGHLYTKI